MKVVAADWLPYCLPLRRPWQTSRGIFDERRGHLLRLRTADGMTGWGDCAPLPEFGIAEAAGGPQDADRAVRHEEIPAEYEAVVKCIFKREP